MSRIEVEKACFALRDEANVATFKENPDGFLSRFELSPEEHRTIREGDVGALYLMDVLYGALEPIARIFKYDNETYVARLRQAAGLPESADQMQTHRRRAEYRKRAS